MKKILSMAVLFLFLFTACNKCSDTDCQNGGTCDNGECVCPFEFEGDNCEAKLTTRLSGQYLISYTIPGFGTETDTLLLTTHPTDAKKFYLGEGTPSEDILGTLTDKTNFTLFGEFYDEEEEETITTTGSGNFTSTGFSATLNGLFPIAIQVTGTKL
jgi:hypothetical protein